jgi:hypothetical protein
MAYSYDMSRRLNFRRKEVGFISVKNCATLGKLRQSYHRVSRGCALFCVIAGCRLGCLPLILKFHSLLALFILVHRSIAASVVVVDFAKSRPLNVLNPLPEVFDTCNVYLLVFQQL